MRFCFLIPFYNHPQSIKKLVEILTPYSYEIIIVDDGSNAESKAVLEQLQGVRIVKRELNGGKGAAIKSGVSVALELGFTHAFQIDADLQHDMDKIPQFIETSKQYPNDLILGDPKYAKDAPKSRLYGRKITDFWVFVNTLGGDIKDVMCGMRIYPLVLMESVFKECKANRMDFDIEILLLAFKADLGFKWIDVSVKYEGGISHFKAFRDNLLISKVHAKHFFLLPKYLLSRLKRSKNV